MRFLFITKKYPPQPDPSGRIVYNLVQELKREGHIVDVIYQDKSITAKTKKSFVDKQEVHYIIQPTKWDILQEKNRSKFISRKNKLLYIIFTYVRKIYLTIMLPYFPDVEPKITRTICHLYKLECLNKNYDAVISFFRPYSCLNSGRIIAKENNVKNHIAIYLDMIEDRDCPKFMPLELYKILIKKGDINILSTSKKVFFPISSENYIYSKYQEYKNKIALYEFPTYTQKNIEFFRRKYENDKNIRFIYAGTLEKSFRNPTTMLMLINEMAKYKSEYQFILDIYGGGNCKDIIESFNSENNMTVTYYGIVDKEKIDKMIIEADVLLNITNDYSAIIPSKIFELFTTGKPILNIINNKDDGSLKYFQRYPLSINVKWDNKDIFEVAATTFNLINSYFNINISMDKINKLFEKNTPKYLATQILNVLKESGMKE